MLDKPAHTTEQLDTIGDKLIANSTREGECIIWLGTRDKYGYGQIQWLGRKYLVHRLGWYVETRILPKDKILHSCDNPGCWRIEHLFEGTQQDNIDDMIAKGRAYNVKGEQCGRAVLTEDNVREIRKLIDLQYLTYREIGIKYNVSHEAIGAIKRKRNWTHVR